MSVWTQKYQAVEYLDTAVLHTGSIKYCWPSHMDRWEMGKNLFSKSVLSFGLNSLVFSGSKAIHLEEILDRKEVKPIIAIQE